MSASALFSGEAETAACAEALSPSSQPISTTSHGKARPEGWPCRAFGRARHLMTLPHATQSTPSSTQRPRALLSDQGSPSGSSPPAGEVSRTSSTAPHLQPVSRPRRLVGSARRAGTSSSASRRSAPLWTVEQVAERCSVSSRTIRRWIAAGALRAHRFPHLVRISEEDLAAFLSAHRDPC